MFEVGPQKLVGTNLQNKAISRRRERVKVLLDIDCVGNAVTVVLKPDVAATHFQGGSVTFTVSKPVTAVVYKTATQYAGAFMYVYVWLQINGNVYRSLLHMDTQWFSNQVKDADACTFTDTHMAYMYTRSRDIFIRVYDITNGPRRVFETQVKPLSVSAASTPFFKQESLLFPHAQLQVVEDQVVEYCLVRPERFDAPEWTAVRFAQKRPTLAYMPVVHRIKSGETHFEHNWEGTGWQLIYTMDKRNQSLSAKQARLFSNEDALDDICMRKAWAQNYRHFSKNKKENVGFITLTEGGVLKAACMFRCNDREGYVPISGKERMPEVELMLICARQTSPRATGSAFMEMLLTQGETLYAGQRFVFTIAQAGDDVIGYYKNAVGANINTSHTLSLQNPDDTFMTVEVPSDRKRKRVYSEKQVQLLLV